MFHTRSSRVGEPIPRTSGQDLSVAHGQIMELFTKIRDIQRKSEESEAMVQEICRDIKKLDYAKRHLTNSITALRRLAMLTAAVTDLEAVCDRRDQYRKCANLVEAVHQLMEYFQQYEAIPKVRSLARRLATVESKLQAAVLDDLKILMGGPTNDNLKIPPENLERLATACLVVDALGKKVQDQVMDWLCDREMTIYQSAFGGAAGSGTLSAAAADDRGAAEVAAHATRLDKFEQRFGWFRSRLMERKEVWGVFPEHWRVPQVLCLTFCKITKAHLKRILSDDEALAGLRADVTPLIRSVVVTNKFERDMAVLFGGGKAGAAGRQGEEADEEAEGGDSMSASEARRRLERFRARVKAEQQAQAAAKESMAKAGDRAREAAEEAIKVAFEGAVSEAFEGVLVEYYIGQEERELLEHLDTVVREEAERRWLPDEEEGDVTGSGLRVLQSANKLFFKIRSSLTRCSKSVSRGPTLVAMAQLFKRVLSGYASDLMRRLPKTAAGTTTATPAAVGGPTDWYIRLTEEDERVVCCLLATADFCRETVEGLAGALARDVRPQFADRVDFANEEAAFVGVASACMQVLVLGLNTRLDGALLEMVRFRWDAIEAPGDDSPFVNTLRKILLDSGPRLGAGLDSVTLSFLCDKTARLFVPRLHETLFRLRKPLGDKGLLQLAVDVDAVRRALLDFPRVAQSAANHGGSPSKGQGEEPQQDPAYMAYVEREMGMVVAAVKVLQSRPEQLVDTYLLLMPPGAQSPAEFQRLCDLKALTRKQQADLMALYQLKAGQAAVGQVQGDRAGAAGAAAAAAAVSGAAGASASGTSGEGGLASAAASNLGTFKLSMNNFTRELAASIPFAGKRAGQDVPMPSSPSLAKTSLHHARTGSTEAASASGAVAAGAFFKETAAKTKEGFAKIGNFIRAANAISAEHRVGADGGGGDSSHH
ncbi:vps53 [Gonium pectorale]|uniref:Vps53 n=1 Tax=Gonium pectorale TaxID=33097 RepID=A0A150GQM2_GONPE|nr:vps53 [Gonium pectorale]|eukprot:KXZ52139.1 vps53 [Gonium pectorale]